MKYCKQKSLKESVAKKASLRLINDIAVIDIDLAAKLRPSIIKFVEAIDTPAANIDKNDLLTNLIDFFKLQSTTDKAEWLKQHKDIADTVKTLMDSKKPVDEEDDTFEPAIDAAPTTDAPALDTAPPTNTPPPPADSAVTLAKMQLETKLRAYIETKLTEFLANTVNSAEIAKNVEGYKVEYATNSYDDSIDIAFDKVLNVLIKLLLDNY